MSKNKLTSTWTVALKESALPISDNSVRAGLDALAKLVAVSDPARPANNNAGLSDLLVQWGGNLPNHTID